MNPEELMRSRYAAFVNEDWEYLVETSLHQTLEELSHPTSIEWLKLEVVDAYDNFVEFKAYYRDSRNSRDSGKIALIHEKSAFTQVDGVWKYDDGVIFNSKIERNEPCPCGSGKKFKKCCAK